MDSLKGAVRLSVWNQADLPIAITIFVDGQIVLESTAPVTDLRPAIVFERKIKLSSGTHMIVAHDRTRSIRKQVEVVLNDIANVDLYLNPEGTELVFDYEETRVQF